MPLSLWGLDDVRKNFNQRVDDTGSAAWNAARGRKQKDDDPANRRASTSTASSSSQYPSSSTSGPRKEFAPPPRKLSTHEMPPPPKKLSAQDMLPPPKTPSANQFKDAKGKKPPPPPPLPARQPSASSETNSRSSMETKNLDVPPLPTRRATSAVVPTIKTTEGEDRDVRPSDLFQRAPSFPVSVKRTETQDGVTNELAEKLAKMRTRSTSPGTARSAITPELRTRSTSPGSTRSPIPKRPNPTASSTAKPPPPSLPPKTPSPQPPPLNTSTKPTPATATKPSLPPRTTPAPPKIAPLKSAQSSAIVPRPKLPFEVSQLHKSILPPFEYPTPTDPNVLSSPGFQTFNRLFPTPLWEIEQSSLFILATLYPSDNTYTFRAKTLEGSVSLIMRDMDGNAHAENSTVITTVGGKRKEQYRSNMVFSTRNLTKISEWGRGDTWFIEEVRGVIVHELTHAWQWSCKELPGGLTEGIADFVRLRANLAPSHWNKSPKGKKWDAGYDTTAYFLDYVDREVYPGFVACVNEWIGQECLRDGKYDEKRMFAEVMPGWGWDVLWEQWCQNCQ